MIGGKKTRLAHTLRPSLPISQSRARLSPCPKIARTIASAKQKRELGDQAPLWFMLAHRPSKNAKNISMLL